MIRFFFSLFSTLFFLQAGYSQKELSLESIWNGEFRQKRLSEIKHLNNGEEYTVFEYDRANKETKIVAKKYIDNSKQRVVLSALDIPDLAYFETYTFNTDETKVLLGLNYKSLYRYSKAAEYYVYEFRTKKLIQLGTDLIFNPTFSPDGKKVAYVHSNNLMVFDLESEKVVQVTTDGQKNGIINGMSDWVYEEEFELVSAFDWNSSSTHLAYLKFNESKVKEYSMPVYGSENYPSSSSFKYPKAGEENSTVSAHIYSLDNKSNSSVNLGNNSFEYIPRLQWTKKPSLLCLQTLNRAQNKLQFSYVNIAGKSTSTFYTETDKAYVEITNDLTFLEDHSFIKSHEQSGYRHLYHYTKNGKLITQITKGDWEMTHFYGVHNNRVYYQSTEKNTTERHIYSIGLDGTGRKCLTKNAGIHNADFCKNFKLFVNRYSNTETPLSYTVIDAGNGKTKNSLLSNIQLKKTIAPLQLPKKTIQTIEINGAVINTWTILPDKGYIIACVDGRGTGFKGSKFKKQTQLQLGKFEALDQIAFAQELSKRPYVDASRIGIWGWSYGGFNALNAILKGNTIFKTAIAVAPVTHWKFYDTIYTERFLGLPKNNEKGYDENSPLSHAANLKGNLLLVHGTADDNVHFQNTLAMISALTKANKQFDLAVYTDKNHGIYGGNTRLQLYTKMTNYILEKL